MRRAKKQQGVNGVEIGLKLAFALARMRRPAYLRDIAKAAGLPPSKTHRYLVSLCRGGLLEQDKVDGRYDLGPGAIMLGLAAQNRLDAFRLVDGVIKRLFDATERTVSVFAWSDRGPVVVRRLEPANPVVVTTRIGSVISVATSAAGRLFVAYLPPKMVKRVVDAEFANGFVSTRADRRITRAQFEDIVADVRKKGFAHVSGDFLAGFDAVSAPVFDAAGQMVMAISVITPTAGPDKDKDPTDILVAACREFSQRLGMS